DALMGMTMLAGGSTEMMMSSGTEEAVYSVFPNPAHTGVSELVVTGFESGNYSGRVEIQRLTGEMVLQQEVSCDGLCNDQVITATQELLPGVYLVNIIANGK